MVDIFSIILQLPYKNIFLSVKCFSSSLSTYSIKLQQHLQKIRRNLKQSGKTHTIWQKSEVLPNCINRHVNSGIKKSKKERPTNYSGEPPYARNPLISSHFSILSPNRTQIPMASIIDSRLGGC